MRKVTVSFLTDQVQGDNGGPAFVEQIRAIVDSNWQYRNAVRDITFVSSEVPPATRTVTEADLVAAGVSAETARTIVNG
jgi:hypothetical protein